MEQRKSPAWMNLATVTNRTTAEWIGQAIDMTTTRPYWAEVVTTGGEEAVSAQGYLAVV